MGPLRVGPPTARARGQSSPTAATPVSATTRLITRCETGSSLTTAARCPEALDLALQGAEHLVGVVPERAMTTEELLRLAQLRPCGLRVPHGAPLRPALAGRAQGGEGDPPEPRLAAGTSSTSQTIPRVPLRTPYPGHGRGRAAQRHGGGIFHRRPRGHVAIPDSTSCPRIGMADVSTLRGLRLRLAWATIPVVAARDRDWIATRTP